MHETAAASISRVTHKVVFFFRGPHHLDTTRAMALAESRGWCPRRPTLKVKGKPGPATGASGVRPNRWHVRHLWSTSTEAWLKVKVLSSGSLVASLPNGIGTGGVAKVHSTPMDTSLEGEVIDLKVEARSLM